MQAEAIRILEERKLSKFDLAKQIGRSEGAVGRALRERPAAETNTLQTIFNYLVPPPTAQDLTLHASALVQRSPEIAALLSAVFREIADLLNHPAATPDRRRNS